MTEPPASGSPRLTVVVCSHNGASGVDRVLSALSRQSVAEALDVVLVDDGSTDGTADVGRRHGARVICHLTNRGVGASRNTGLAAVQTPAVAYLDDDCEPAPDWASRMLSGFEDDGVIGIGGTIKVGCPDSFIYGYLTRHNPLAPLELDLAARADIAYRLGRYLVRNWQRQEPAGRRRVFAFAGASMSFRTEALRTVGGFDESLTFGPEDLDVCIRLRAVHGIACLLFEPSAVVVHHFDPGLGDTLRRSRAYGRGHARLLVKYSQMRPTVFPLPGASLGLLAVSIRHPKAVLAAIALPHVIHPRGLLEVVKGDPRTILDAYVALLQEAAFNVGVFEGIARSWPRTRGR